MSSSNRDILRFLLRASLMALAAIAPFVAWYVCADPFRVLYHYDVYYDDPSIHPVRIGLNKGMVTVNTYQNNIDKDYNAFIFGSSISCYYDANEWRELIESQDSIKARVTPFHFDSASESPMSMSRKIDYLNSHGAKIDHALIILDPIILANDDNDSPFAIDPVEFQPDILHFIKYHYTFFRASANADFFKSFIAAKISGKADNIGHNPIFESQPIVYDPLTNQESIPAWDEMISEDPTLFYNDHPLLPPNPDVAPGDPVITDGKRNAFNKIADIFNHQHTDYRIIISPNRRGVSLSPSDLQTLQEIFDPARIHDFSSLYARGLQTDTLLYDNTHYRPPFASKLMHKVYDN